MGVAEVDLRVTEIVEEEAVVVLLNFGGSKGGFEGYRNNREGKKASFV